MEAVAKNRFSRFLLYTRVNVDVLFYIIVCMRTYVDVFSLVGSVIATVLPIKTT